MRKQKAIINIFFSLLLQFVTVFSGLILPRLIIESFGSEINGLVNSISSFVAYITLLQSGVGGVIRAALYKPLAKKNHDQLCVIVRTTETFFKKIALATVVYIGILAIIFVKIIASEYEWVFTASLIVII